MRKVALVMGNGAYTEKPLKNPRNDASAIAANLEEFNFVVHECLDETYYNMDLALKNFRAELYDAEVGLVFFAGHGIQIDGVNYLLAVDSDMDTALDAKHTSLNLNRIIDVLNASNVDTGIVILDACRNNPWERKWERSASGGGLAPVYAPRGTLIAFATSPGQVADDGVGRENGLYTSALLRHIKTPDCTIEAMFKKVRNTLSVESRGKQISWEHTSLSQEFYFNLGTAARIDKYSATSLRDSVLELDESFFSHELIRKLKILTWDVQNKAITEFTLERAKRTNVDNLFVIGRNIYQAACGHAHAALSFIQNFVSKTNGLFPLKREALLDGILFEIFFDSDGKLRERFKDECFNEVFSLQKYPSLSDSFDFIAECLIPYASRFYALPGKSGSTSIDISLDGAGAGEAPKISHVYLASKNILRPDDEEDDEDEKPGRYRKIRVERLEAKLAQQLLIPQEDITFNYVGGLRGIKVVQFPSGWTLRKHF